MKIATIIVRVLLGLLFFGGGLAFFLMKMPDQQLPANATEFNKVMMSTHYMQVVKVFEMAGGLLLLLGRFVPLGLTLLGPVIVNILIFDALMVPSFLPMGLIVAALALFLVWRYRDAFAGLVKP